MRTTLVKLILLVVIALALSGCGVNYHVNPGPRTWPAAPTLPTNDAAVSHQTEKIMATVRLLTDEDLSPEARAVFADIRATRKSDFVNNFWRALAHDPVTLKRTWESVKQVMGPGVLEPKVKEMIYIAVSIAHACPYCIHSHTANARAKGMSEEEYREAAGDRRHGVGDEPARHRARRADR